MGEWEQYAFNHPGGRSESWSERDRFRDDVVTALKLVFGEFCIAKDSGHVREVILTYGNPPEYSPERLRIDEMRLGDTDSLFVDVSDPQARFAKRMRYLMVRVNGKWLIDSRVKTYDDGRVEPMDL
jgi:hypothetical protein